MPAYNAAATIDETLRSVRSQTHRPLEILVVDDGSSDATAEIAARHQAADWRLRLITQRNAGVAAARNRGIREARAEYVAPVDADDLWAPTKLARQLAVFAARGPRTALIYTWSVSIDSAGRVIDAPTEHTADGDVLHAICRTNLPGNGSSTLMRRAAVLDAGGYDASLRARRAEGCEDIALYARIAENHEFGLVPAALTGYRSLPMSMSSDGLQMLRSWLLVEAGIRQRQPACAAELDAARHDVTCWLIQRALDAGRRGAALRLARSLGRAGAAELVRLVLRNWLRPWRNSAPVHPLVGSRFVIGEPTDWPAAA